ncbi:MAG: peptidoglycan DD-metalloendopeptidase family protein [Pseudomonadota bacterium]
MQQRPLFNQQRKRFRWIRGTALVAAGAVVAGLVALQVAEQSEPDTQSPASNTPNNEIPLPIHSSAASPNGAPAISRTGDTTTPQAVNVSLESRPSVDIPGRQEALEAIETPEPETSTQAAPERHVVERTIEVSSGDTLSTIFERAGLGYSDVLQVLDLGEEAKRLERIRPGDTLVLQLEDDEFAGLKYDLDAESELNIFREQGDDLVAEIKDLPSQTALVAAGGVVKGSLYQSAVATGIPPAKVMELAEVFGWKVDFVRDVRNGDEFKLIYEVREREGERLGTGNLIAAEYRNGDRTIQAVRYTSPDGTTGYYEPDGSSLERGFLRYPVEFSRISSNFNPKRLHPIHNTVRPHNGVDLAAPTGTPIRAAASGRVTFAGWKHGYGRVVLVRHDETYETRYAHMSGFKGNLSRGDSVEKGDVIGFVGMTGAATGPHLHYELRVRGKPYNPVKVELPEANPIPSKHREDFLAATRTAMDQLARVQIDSGSQPIRLARNESTPSD